MRIIFLSWEGRGAEIELRSQAFKSGGLPSHFICKRALFSLESSRYVLPFIYERALHFSQSTILVVLLPCHVYWRSTRSGGWQTNSRKQSRWLRKRGRRHGPKRCCRTKRSCRERDERKHTGLHNGVCFICHQPSELYGPTDNSRYEYLFQPANPRKIAKLVSLLSQWVVKYPLILEPSVQRTICRLKSLNFQNITCQCFFWWDIPEKACSTARKWKRLGRNRSPFAWETRPHGGLYVSGWSRISIRETVHPSQD